ncbi:DUF1993 domain-containing protein [Rhizobium sp. TRM95111]|uniref:DUF1993 domain-containing protein n=1 Tax=Rhizobium alarense TaxID=2846851 RepID=UPI001F2ABB14|nr:DUF1993 domain-containing protein [Rhizobium alarense]MCF3641624.1 DUF1993 domain-containing protein [Rhizobium alarense]
MTLSMYTQSVPAFLRGFTVLSSLFDKAEAFAEAKKISPDILANARLAPDMLPLAGQVQRMSDTAKNAVGRLTGSAAPSFPDEEKTFADLRERIDKTVAYLETVDASALQGSEERTINLSVGKLKVDFTGQAYLTTFALPNFYFHLTTAYAILRHNGVDVGKRDFLGSFE